MKQYTKIVISNSIFSVGTGLFSPFWYLYLVQKAGANNFPYLIGSMLLSTALFSYISGIISDRIGRKAALVFSRVILAVLVYLYIYAGSLVWLYVLQIASGALIAIEQTVSMSLIGDLTTTDNRGKYVGLYNLVIGVFVALMVLSGGLLGGISLNVIFVASAAIILLSALPLMKL